MLETSGRLLRLLSLFQAQRYWSGTELAARLKVTSRTLRRDVDRLRSLGYPVNSTSGVAGGYQLGVGGKLPPLLLDDEEAVAVAVGLRTAASGVTGIEEASVRALAKLEQVLPSRLRQRVSAFHSVIIPLTGLGPTVDAGTLSAIAAACRNSQRLLFDYRSRAGEASKRETEPHRLVHTGRRWYLAAWDLDRNNWRTFRVDRIQPKLYMGARFMPRKPPDGDFAAYVARSVTSAPYKYQVKVVLHASAEEVSGRIPPNVAIIEPIDSRTCLLASGGSSLEGMAIYLALIGFEFEVREPPELVERVRSLAAQFARAVSAIG